MTRTVRDVVKSMEFTKKTLFNTQENMKIPYFFSTCRQWSEWKGTPCSKSCGGGSQIQSRTVLRNLSGHGQPCTGLSRRLATCEEGLCPGVTAAIVLPTLLFLTGVLAGFIYYKRKYSRLDNAKVFFTFQYAKHHPNSKIES